MDMAHANSSNCLACRTRAYGFCTELTSADLLKMTRFKSGDRKVRAGKDIFSSGEPCSAIYNLVEGWAFRYSLLEDGRRQILDFVLPGAVLGFHPEKGVKATFGAQALTDAVVCAIPQENLASLSREIPETGMRLARLISRDCSLAYDHLISIGRQSARERVAHLILELFIRYRTQWPGHRPDEMHLPLTQEHIGDAAGLTAVHVNRVLRNLREEGVLEFHYRRLRVLNPDRLVEIAEVDPHLAIQWMHQLARPDNLPPRASKPAPQRALKNSSCSISPMSNSRATAVNASAQRSASIAVRN